jgi:hypothetical protein
MATRREIQNGADFAEQVTPVTANDAPVVDASDMDLSVIAHKKNHTLLQKDHARKALAEQYKREPKKSVMVAPMYAPYFGKVMHIMINGISIAVPCDGRPYDIPETFAGEVFRRINAINDQQSKAKRYSDVSTNIEGAPGELALF